MTIEVSFPTDSDGFLSQECPSCGQRFKVLFGQGSEEPISFCPYCCHNDQGCWSTQEQSAHLQAVALDIVVAPELKKIERELKRASDGTITVSIESDFPEISPPPMETDDPFDMLCFPCCNEIIKVNRQQNHFCIICGKEVDMTLSDSKRVFLSHKGANKEFVSDFKETLELLGYEPWLDDEAMPAGTRLERGLLQGMKDSCGVVFFITPEFKDEGYLAAEIDYAIAEERSKGDKFAIITLQFVGDGGRKAPIPDLLRPFIWKMPKTDLEALREIVRALPVVSGPVDWRDEITGVVTPPRLNSSYAELSDEAKEILREAVNADGGIMHIQGLGWETIRVNNRDLIPDGNPRTVAMWEGGLEDLQRRGYIKDQGHKRQSFEVTREGYRAADELGLNCSEPIGNTDSLSSS